MLNTTSLLRAAVFLMAVPLIAACSSSGHDDNTPASTPASSGEPDVAISTIPNHLRFASDVPSDQVTAVNESVSSLYVLPLTPSASDVVEMSRMMKNSDVSPAGMQAWMEARVGYVVDKDFDLKSHLNISDENYVYPTPGVIPDALSNNDEIAATPHAADDNSDVIMLNIGAELYGRGKQYDKLLVIDIPGQSSVRLTSPRVGLLQVGPGLFPDLQGHHVQNVLLDIFRAGTLFHEARHSDGNGKTIGFLHSKCPEGHDYAGKYACDAATNGPYTIGALVHKNLMNSCTSCSEHSKHALQLIYLDIADRVLDPAKAPQDLSPQARAGVDWDDAPEGQR